MQDYTPHQKACIVSADTHVGPLMEQYAPYCEARWREQFDHFAGRLANDAMRQAEGAKGTSIATASADEWPQDYMEAIVSHVEAAGDSDPHQRLRDLDRDGVAGQVIFHGSENGQPLPFSRDVGLIPVCDDHQLGRVGVRMYNRWLSDFCSVAPERSAGIAQLPIWDPAECVVEAEWARANGLKALNFPAVRPYDDSIPLYPEPVWDRFFDVCESLALPLVSHAAGMEPVAALRYGGLGALALNMAESSLLMRRTAGWLIFGGVFQRHPGLRWVITETQGNWIDSDLDYMDSAYFTRPQAELRKRMPDAPSALWRRHVYLGASFVSNKEVRHLIELGLEDRVMWGSDYPHLEGTWPQSEKSLRMAMAGVPPATINKIIGQNAISIYGFDSPALAEVAGRIGPPFSNLQHPLATAPPATEWSLGFREVGPYT